MVRSIKQPVTGVLHKARGQLSLRMSVALSPGCTAFRYEQSICYEKKRFASYPVGVITSVLEDRHVVEQLYRTCVLIVKETEFRNLNKIAVFWNVTSCSLVGRRSYRTAHHHVAEYRTFDTDRLENSELTVETFTSSQCIVSLILGLVISKLP